MNKQLKIWMKTALILILVLALAACGNSGGNSGSSASGGSSSGSGATTGGSGGGSKESAAPEYELNLGHGAPVGSHYDTFAVKLKELVEERTNGRVTITIHPANALGGERTMVESVQAGSLDIAISSDAPMANFAPKVSAIGFPFLFKDNEHAYRVLDGEVGEILNKELAEQANLRNLFWFETGFYHVLTSKKPVRTLEDMKGLKFRSQENNVQIDFLNALGTNPTPIAFNELYTSAQQGVIDGFSSSFSTVVPNKLHEVVDYMTLNGLYYSSAVAVMNNKFFEGLPADIQEIFLEAAKEAGRAEREFVAQKELEYRAEMEAAGVEIIENIDIKPFRDAVQPVYDKYAGDFGDIHEIIRSLE